jgi:hypothetical protein
MEKKELQQQSEKIIIPINKITGINFKLIRVDCYLRFTDLDESENFDEFNFYYEGLCKSHSIHMMYYSNDDSMKYKLMYMKIDNRIGRSKEFSELFYTELELCVFLKKSKFKVK